MSNSNRQQSRWGAPPTAADNREEERDSRRRANSRGYEQDGDT